MRARTKQRKQGFYWQLVSESRVKQICHKHRCRARLLHNGRVLLVGPWREHDAEAIADMDGALRALQSYDIRTYERVIEGPQDASPQDAPPAPPIEEIRRRPAR